MDQVVTELLGRASEGDQPAIDRLLGMHRDRLRTMVALRMDQRLAPRVDPSDVVQEALAEASAKLPRYLDNQAIPFYPWLRQIAWECLIRQHRRHLDAQGRSVTREAVTPRLPDDSVLQLADRFAADGTSPSLGAMRNELRRRVQQLLEQIDSRDREVLVLRFLEQLSTAEIAASLQLTVEGVRSRQRRALERLSTLLADLIPENPA